MNGVYHSEQDQTTWCVFLVAENGKVFETEVYYDNEADALADIDALRSAPLDLEPENDWYQQELDV